MVALSLLVAYRNRPQHLARLVRWYQRYQKATRKHKIEVIVVEFTKRATTSARNVTKAGGRYFHICDQGQFNKSLALNLGLANARGKLVTSYDVDLLPFAGVLSKHIDAALASPLLLITGHRLMASSSNVDPSPAESLVTQVDLGPEDWPISLRNQLLHGERHGQVPLFERKRLLAIGGWDEQFIGWGCEDQDVIERYLKDDLLLARSPDLVYLHYPHLREDNWHEGHLVSRNRHLYSTRAGQRRKLC